MVGLWYIALVGRIVVCSALIPVILITLFCYTICQIVSFLYILNRRFSISFERLQGCFKRLWLLLLGWGWRCDCGFVVICLILNRNHRRNWPLLITFNQPLFGRARTLGALSESYVRGFPWKGTFLWVLLLIRGLYLLFPNSLRSLNICFLFFNICNLFCPTVSNQIFRYLGGASSITRRIHDPPSLVVVVTTAQPHHLRASVLLNEFLGAGLIEVGVDAF